MSARATQMGATPYPGGCRFAVWAPNADAVFVVGEFNQWQPEASPMAAGADGVWSAAVAGAAVGQQYRYRLRRGAEEVLRIDPYARRVTSSVGNAVIPRPPAGTRHPPFRVPRREEWIIYELHIGTFGKRGREPGPGDLQGAVDRLDHLAELGVNAVEIMPPAEFAGAYSWGYNPAHIFAVESDYGTPLEFQAFVDRAHQLDIAVIVDVVYNHLGPSDLCLWRFDGWSENGKGGIYFYNDDRCRTPWGDTRPDYGRQRVREYLRDNALMWIRDYGVDGLRWDMSAYIRNVHGRDGDPAGDLPDGWSLMQWINGEVKAQRGDALLVAEDLQGNPSLTRAAAAGGAGFDAQWTASFVHAVRAALVAAEDADRDLDAVCAALTPVADEDAFARVVYTESHDEVANGKARVPEEVDPGRASSWVAKKKSALGGVLVFTAPGIPMLFQGQEFLEDDWFHDQDPLDWGKKQRFAGILQLYRDLIALRRNRHGYTRGLCGRGLEILHCNRVDKVLAYHRWDGGGPGDSVVVVANFSTRAFRDYRLDWPAAGDWRVRFNSDSRYYAPDFGDFGDVWVRAQSGEGSGSRARAAVRLAAYSAMILSQDI